jgi:hypothetical protein
MAALALRDSSGDIDAIIVASEGAPPVAAADPGQVVSEVEYLGGSSGPSTQPGRGTTSARTVPSDFWRALLGLS